MDTFTSQYIETALWSSNDDNGVPLDSNFTVDKISPETLQTMIEDCREFQEKNHEMIQDDLSLAGHDFWLTRNGHGVGFWEKGDWPDHVGKELTKSSKDFGEFNLEVGADGIIYNF